MLPMHGNEILQLMAGAQIGCRIHAANALDEYPGNRMAGALLYLPVRTGWAQRCTENCVPPLRIS